MIVIYLQFIGWGVFVISTILLGILLRSRSSKLVAKITIRITHLIILFVLILPMLIGLFYPGLTHYDDFLGIPPLPFRSILLAVGLVFIPIGIFFHIISVFTLMVYGDGMPAFILSKKVVEGYVYKLTRNPMSLGFYLLWLAFGLLAGSTYFTLWILIAFIPAHIFYIKFIEEHELELRFGQPYREYKQRVPFLIPNIRNVSGTESINNDV
jgi:protein-S-isoprenylcysteine O-methyltransferase Ste14